MNFGTDSTQIGDLVKTLKENAGKMDTIISNIFQKLESLESNGWKGTAYDAFLAGCKSYEPSLKLIPDVIIDFANYFENTVTTNVTAMDEEVEKGLNQIKSA